MKLSQADDLGVEDYLGLKSLSRFKGNHGTGPVLCTTDFPIGPSDIVHLTASHQAAEVSVVCAPSSSKNGTWDTLPGDT